MNQVRYLSRRKVAKLLRDSEHLCKILILGLNNFNIAFKEIIQEQNLLLALTIY